MKITKARLKEIIKEELQSEVFGSYIAARARKQMDDGDSDDKDKTKMSDFEDMTRDLRRKVKEDPSYLERFLKMLKDQDLTEGGERGEGAMADSQLNRIADLAMMIDEMVSDETNLPEWVESKITKAQDYMSAVMNYMKGEMADAQEEMMEEEKEEAMNEAVLRERIRGIIKNVKFKKTWITR